MPYPGWQPTPGCLSNINKMGGRICDQPNTHCYDSQDYTHRICQCMDPYMGGCTSSPPPLPAGCCHYTADSPIPSYDDKGLCYCCCSCFAYDTPVADGQGQDGVTFKVVQDFQIGDPVLVADHKLEWKAGELRYSSGAPASQSALVKVDYMIGDQPRSLLVTRDQVFFTPDGKLIRADRLKPGDPLVQADGGTTPVLKIAAGIFSKGVWHIATSAAPATGIDGHLLNSNGIVTGDYALQIAGFDAEPNHPLMVADHHTLPVFGTPEYHDAVGANADDAARLLSAGAADEHPAIAGFTQMQGSVPSFPEGTQSYFTDDQAWDLQQSPERAPAGSQVGYNIAEYLVRLFGGMYPRITFVFDQRNDVPNAYAFEIYQRPFVVITSGLVRMNPVMMESLAVVIAHCVARLQKLAPENDAGYSCKSTADYAVASVLSYVFLGKLYSDMISPGIEQVGTLFDLIDPDHAGGDGTTCMGVSLDCRLSAMNAGMRSQPLPRCAGGPPDATLAVTGASAAADADDQPVVTVSFSAALDPATVERPANYEFSPLLAVNSAAVDPKDPSKAIVRPDAMEKGSAYVLHVIGVTSDKGNPLKPSASRATVTLD